MEVVDPLQPYFVLSTNLYRKLIPRDSPVAHFYQFTYTEENSGVNGVVPDGAIDLILDIQTGAATLSGSVKCATDAPFLQRHSYFGVRFKPGAMEHFADISFHELTGTSVELSDLPYWKILEERIRTCNSFEQRAAVLKDSLFHYAAQNCRKETPELLQDMLNRIYRSQGMVTVHDLETALFYSKRHLLRLFRQYIGMDIKSFCSIVRFQSVLSELNSGNRTGLAEIAQKYGYYDQTHFQKEFKKYSMLSPGNYRRMILGSGYHDRIQLY